MLDYRYVLTDLYKLTMEQLILQRHPDARAAFRFICRNPNARLGDRLDLGELREHCAEISRTTITPKDLAAITRGGIPEGIIKPWFLKHLKSPEFRVAPISIERHGSNLEIVAEGTWLETTRTEIPVLRTVAYLHLKALMREKGITLRELVEHGRAQRAKKVSMLKQHPTVRFVDFATRRCQLGDSWLKETLKLFKRNLPETQFLGTSNVMLGYELGLPVFGTYAHELPMGYWGIYNKNRWHRQESQRKMLRDWFGLYGNRLGVVLPDTFTSRAFFEQTMTDELLLDTIGFRQDSGDPIAFMKLLVEFLTTRGVNPMSKKMFASDGLTVEKMIELNMMANGIIPITFGYGGDAVNDFGDFLYSQISIVMKLDEINGQRVCKLSDNPAKATGDLAAIRLAKSDFLVDDLSLEREECKR